MTRLLVVLQNPWARGNLRNGYNPQVWKREFEKSRAGRRLQVALPVDRKWSIHFSNACPVLASGPDGVYAPDARHVRRTLKRVSPNLVLACGKLAEEALITLWEGPLLCVPHPSSRVLTNDLYEVVHKIIVAWGVFERNPGWREREWSPIENHARAAVPRLAIRQRRGSYEIVALKD